MNFLKKTGFGIAFLATSALAQTEHEKRIEAVNKISAGVIGEVSNDLDTLGFSKDSSIKILPESNFDTGLLKDGKYSEIKLGVDANFIYKIENTVIANSLQNLHIHTKKNEFFNFSWTTKNTSPSVILWFHQVGKLLKGSPIGKTPSDIKLAAAAEKFMKAANLTDIKAGIELLLESTILSGDSDIRGSSKVGLNFRQILTLAKENLKLSGDGSELSLLLENFKVSVRNSPESLVISKFLISIKPQSIVTDLQLGLKGAKDTETNFQLIEPLANELNLLSEAKKPDVFSARKYEQAMGNFKSMTSFFATYIAQIFGAYL